MSVFKKVFMITIFVLSISYSLCYAIDENQLNADANTITTQSNTVPTPNTDNTLDIETIMQTNNSVENQLDTNQSTENGNTVTSSASTSISDYNSSNSISTSDSDSEASTIVSSVSSASKTSTITNILNIGLLVVGVLLIFLAIAILIRLNS